MKKLLIIASMFLFVVPANAYYVTTSPIGGYNSVNTFNNRTYNNTVTGTNFGSNAAFLPQNVQRAGMIQRQIQYEKQYLDTLKNTQNINVNVNHNGIPVTTYHYPNGYYNNGYYTNTYYNNGYNRYYNNGYIQPNVIHYNRGNGMTFPGVRVY